MQKPCYDEKGNKIGDADCSPLFEKAVWFVPLYNQRPAKLANEWHYFVRVDDNVGSWGIQEVNQNAGCGDRQNQPCIRITLHTRNDGHTTPDHSGFPEQLPTGTIPPRSKKCCNNDNEWEYPPYYEIVAQVEDLNQNSKGIVSIRLEVCLDEATCFDQNPNNDIWQTEQECNYQPTGQTSDRNKWCFFRLNTLSRAGWGTVQANHPLKWRVIAQNSACNTAVIHHTANIYPSFACPIASTSAGHNCGGYCYHARRVRNGRVGNHDGIDINGNNLTVTTPCGGDFYVRRRSGTCNPSENPQQRRQNAGSGYGRYADVDCSFEDGSVLTLRFAHLASITHTGSTINQGDQVGTSGATGNACYCGPNESVVDNPHLHFEVLGYDPKRFLPLNCPNENYANLDSGNRSRCCRANDVVERSCTNEPAMCPAQYP
ncbi:MAG: M23 family metallopeptidase [bacterium JZ-2024 1]